MDKKEGKRMEKVLSSLWLPLVMALDESKLDLSKIDAVRAGVCVGSGIGGIILS